MGMRLLNSIEGWGLTHASQIHDYLECVRSVHEPRLPILEVQQY